MIHEKNHGIETILDILRTEVRITFILLPDETS